MGKQIYSRTIAFLLLFSFVVFADIKTDSAKVNVIAPNDSGTVIISDTAHFKQIVTIDSLLHLKKVLHAYGGFQDSNAVIATPGADTWTIITNDENDLWQGIEVDGFTLANDTMTVTYGGDYTGVVSMSVGGNNNKDFEFRVFNVTQDTIAGYHMKSTGLGAGNYIGVTVPFYLEADAGDEFIMQVQCTTDASDPTIHDAIFYITYLHE